MDTQVSSCPVTGDVRRRRFSAMCQGTVLFLCMIPGAVRGQTGLSASSDFFLGIAAPEHDRWHVLADTLNPRHSQERTLLTRDDVQRELGLSPRQQEQITALSEKTENYLAALPSKTSALLRQATAGKDLLLTSHSFTIKPDGEITGKGADAPIAREVSVKMQEERTQVLQEDQKQRDAILTSEQRTRLKELETQWRGPFLLLDRPGMEDMNISEAQWKQIQVLWERLQTRVERNEKTLAPKAAPFIREYGDAAVKQEGFRALMRQLWRDDRKARAEVEQQALAALSPAQRQQWSAWKGKPFAFQDYDTIDRPSLPR
jgi:hypothetical protein